jgi:hypothetical protein
MRRTELAALMSRVFSSLTEFLCLQRGLRWKTASDKNPGNASPATPVPMRRIRIVANLKRFMLTTDCRHGTERSAIMGLTARGSGARSPGTAEDVANNIATACWLRLEKRAAAISRCKLAHVEASKNASPVRHLDSSSMTPFYLRATYECPSSRSVIAWSLARRLRVGCGWSEVSPQGLSY